jgi:hypothetical protein
MSSLMQVLSCLKKRLLHLAHRIEHNHGDPIMQSTFYMCRAGVARDQVSMQLEAANGRASRLAQDGHNMDSELKRTAQELTQTQALLADSQRQSTQLHDDLDHCKATAYETRAAFRAELAAAEERLDKQRCVPANCLAVNISVFDPSLIFDELSLLPRVMLAQEACNVISARARSS